MPVDGRQSASVKMPSFKKSDCEVGVISTSELEFAVSMDVKEGGKREIQSQSSHLNLVNVERYADLFFN